MANEIIKEKQKNTKFLHIKTSAKFFVLNIMSINTLQKILLKLKKKQSTLKK